MPRRKQKWRQSSRNLPPIRNNEPPESPTEDLASLIDNFPVPPSWNDLESPIHERFEESDAESESDSDSSEQIADLRRQLELLEAKLLEEYIPKLVHEKIVSDLQAKIKSVHVENSEILEKFKKNETNSDKMRMKDLRESFEVLKKENERLTIQNGQLSIQVKKLNSSLLSERNQHNRDLALMSQRVELFDALQNKCNQTASQLRQANGSISHQKEIINDLRKENEDLLNCAQLMIKQFRVSCEDRQFLSTFLDAKKLENIFYGSLLGGSWNYVTVKEAEGAAYFVRQLVDRVKLEESLAHWVRTGCRIFVKFCRRAKSHFMESSLKRKCVYLLLPPLIWMVISKLTSSTGEDEWITYEPIPEDYINIPPPIDKSQSKDWLLFSVGSMAVAAYPVIRFLRKM